MSNGNSQPANRSDARTAEAPYELEEVRALMQYASETGLDKNATICTALNKAIKANDEDAILKHYTDLCKKTYSKNRVNGRTLIDTDKRFSWRSKIVLMWGLFFLLLALGTEALDLWYTDNDVPFGGWQGWLFNIHFYFLDRFSPFLWGATGASVFLIKQLSDRAADRCFDSKKWKGWGTRIILGALVGAIVVTIYDPSAFTEDKLNIDANAVAFLAGVGVKVFYGAIEKLIEIIAQRFNIGTPEAKAKTPVEILSEYLGRQLAVAIEGEDEPRQKLIKEMISELSTEAAPEAS
jgi:hypothetical protein